MLLAYFLLGFVALASAKKDKIEIFPTDFNADDEVLSIISENVADRFAKEYLNFIRTGIESPSLHQLSKQLSATHSQRDIFRKEIQELSKPDKFVTCTTCRATAKVMFQTFQEDGELNGPDADVHAKRIMVGVCNRLNLQTEEVCGGLFDSNWPTIEYILHNTEMDSRSFCWLFLELDICKSKNPDFDFEIAIDKGNGPITAPKSDIPKSGNNDLIILQLTDIHYDPLYEPGSLAECDEPLCCQREKNSFEGTSKAAGYWGDYRDCDAPWQLIENALDHIKKTHPKIDYIYQTGDIVDHMVWGTSVEKNKQVLSKVHNAIEQAFPNIPIYSCVGNHEPHPLNVFSPEDVPEDVNTHWLYEHLSVDWSASLPEEAQATVLKGGYYTVTPRAGFRIISLNNNDCYSLNWWLFERGTTKIPQLQWLHDTLLAAENNHEYVHILAHIPSGDGSCWNTWAREYNRIIARFSKTISGIFNGHSHKDEMNVHYSNGHAVGISWNGGALTTFSNKNPNYRVYQVESETMQVFDHETWIFNLTEANEHGKDREPNWFKEYQFSTEFTTDTSPHGIDKLLTEFAENPNQLRKFWKYKTTSADPQIANGCGMSCLKSQICRIATTVNNQRDRCIELQIVLENSLNAETTPTQTPTPTPTPTISTESTSTTKKPGGDGAGSLQASLLVIILSICATLKYIV